MIMLRGVASDFLEMKFKVQGRGWLGSMEHAGIDGMRIELEQKLRM